MRLRVAVLLVIAAAGCRTVPPSQAVAVVDAETGRPVPSATVVGGLAPAEHQAGADGLVRLTVHREAGDAIVSASATGYLPETTDLRLPEAGDSTTPSVKLFAGPTPTLSLNLPRAYRGPVVVTIDPSADGPPSGRAFTATVADDGKVTVAGPPVLAKLTAPDVKAVRFDGTSMPKDKDAPPGEVGFRWAKSGTNLFHFMVGTQAECDEYAKSLALPDPHRGDGGKGKGGGGGGRRGGGGGRRGGGGMGSGGGM